MIPSTPNCSLPYPLNRRLYRRRLEVECFLHRLKVNRRMATLFQERATSLLSMLQVVFLPSDISGTAPKRINQGACCD